MRLRDYLAHRAVDTPLESVAIRVRELLQSPIRRRHPELNGIYIEKTLMRQVFKRLITDPMNCVDGGTHIGTMLAQMRRLAPGGRHIAFEPIPYKAAWLRRKFPHVHVSEQALSDTNREAPFFHNALRSGFSSLATRGPGEVDQFTVECVRLDDVIEPEQPIGFIKLNVQGAELSALHGAASLLDRDRPSIVFHCSHDGMAVSGITPDDVFGYLVREHGYLLYTMSDFLGRGDPLSFDLFARAMEYPFQAFNFLAIADNSPHRPNANH